MGMYVQYEMQLQRRLLTLLHLELSVTTPPDLDVMS